MTAVVRPGGGSGKLISSSRRNIYNHTHGTTCSKAESEAKIISLVLRW